MPFTTPLQFQLETGPKLFVVLTSDLSYKDKRGREFLIPKGFRCDLSSRPKIILSFASSWHLNAKPGTLHDCGYRWFEIWGIKRRAMDRLYYWALRDDGVSRTRAWLQLKGLRLAGWRAWRRWRKTPQEEKGIQPPEWKQA